jgi:hypothetical protein
MNPVFSYIDLRGASKIAYRAHAPNDSDAQKRLDKINRQRIEAILKANDENSAWRAALINQAAYYC